MRVKPAELSSKTTYWMADSGTDSEDEEQTSVRAPQSQVAMDTIDSHVTHDGDQNQKVNRANSAKSWLFSGKMIGLILLN